MDHGGQGAPLLLLALITFWLIGVYLACRLPANDMERSYLDLEREEMARRYQREFGRPIPRRMPFRLPAEYWLYAWTSDLLLARSAALVVSTVGMWLTMAYAERVQPGAGAVAGAILITSPTIVGALASATYVPYTATLWVGGLYAIYTGHEWVAIACGVALALVRASAWGMALALWALTLPYSLIAAAGVAGYLWRYQQPVVLSQGWARLLRREPCPVMGIPRDGWHYALRVLGKRYESWGAWGIITIVLYSRGAEYNAEVIFLLTLTLLTFTLTHLPRALIRPKWVVGYVPEFVLPVAVALAVALAR